MKATVIMLILALSTFINLNSQIPSLSFYDLENNYVELTDLKGENLTVIDFWATWCKPCHIAIPELNEMYHDYNERGVNIIGINIDSPRNQSKVRPFSRSRGIDYPVLLDTDQDAMQEMNVVVVPTLMIFNDKGEQVFSHEGFRPGDQDYIRSAIEKHLEKQ